MQPLGGAYIDSNLVIPHDALGSVIGSSAMSAAAACSTMVSDPAHAVPDAAQDDCEPDAYEIRPKGIHATCPYCPYSTKPKYWTRLDHYHAHIRIDHPGERIPEPSGYTCPCHGRPFASRWEMERHTVGRLRVPCPHCGRPLTKASMARHLIRCVHAKGHIQKHACVKCDRVFSSTLGAFTASRTLAIAHHQHEYRFIEARKTRTSVITPGPWLRLKKAIGICNLVTFATFDLERLQSCSRRRS